MDSELHGLKLESIESSTRFTQKRGELSRMGCKYRGGIPTNSRKTKHPGTHVDIRH